jgi:hypothetical protein
VVSTYLSVKLREGLKRIADEHPGLDFGVSSPGLVAAEEELGRACRRWSESFNTLTAEVVRAFHAWERELIAANRSQQKLFA